MLTPSPLRRSQDILKASFSAGDVYDSKALAIAKRNEIRKYISEDRDTIVKKWKALTEYIHREENDRKNFYVKKTYNETRVLPETISRFLRTLKKTLSTRLRKGGTTFSIVRDMFIYWDAGRTGTLSTSDLHKCLISLGAQLDEGQIAEIVSFYSVGENSMGYQKLLEDLQKGEPTLVQRAPTERESDEDREKRFKLMEDKFLKKPRVVEKFLEAVRDSIMKKLITIGGTPYSHVREAFLKSSSNYSDTLDEEGLVKAVRGNMGLAITVEQAKEIVSFYDRRNTGEMDYKMFLGHVCDGMEGFLTYNEETPQMVLKRQKSLHKNPFFVKEFKALPNKTLESFKRKVRHNLFEKIANYGGTVKSWMKDAFLRWDSSGMGKITSWQHLQGACKRFGFVLTEDECRQIMASYATDDSGSIEYWRMIDDCSAGDPHFLTITNTGVELARTATSRAPLHVSSAISKFKRAIDHFSICCKGEVEAKDVMLGVFLRVDKAHIGHIQESSFRKVLKALGIALTDEEISDIMIWFDSNGSKTMDYNEFTRQIYGTDLMTRSLTLPAISLHRAKASPEKLQETGIIPVGEIFEPSDKNLKLFKSRAYKRLEKELRKKTIASEKELIVNKLKSIEVQKNVILEKQRLKAGHASPIAHNG